MECLPLLHFFLLRERYLIIYGNSEKKKLGICLQRSRLLYLSVMLLQRQASSYLVNLLFLPVTRWMCPILECNISKASSSYTAFKKVTQLMFGLHFSPLCLCLNWFQSWAGKKMELVFWVFFFEPSKPNKLDSTSVKVRAIISPVFLTDVSTKPGHNKPWQNWMEKQPVVLVLEKLPSLVHLASL